MTEETRYDDIINLPHHVSRTRPAMPMQGRAAQFSPFAALTGYDEAIRETGRVTQRRIELSEDRKEELDRAWQYLLAHASEHPEVTVTYFVPDARKDGGAYVTVTATLKKADPTARRITLSDGREIRLNKIIQLRLIPVAAKFRKEYSVENSCK